MEGNSKAPDSADNDKQYDRAIKLIQYYVQLQWLIFGAFLLAETVLLGSIAQTVKDGPREIVVGGSVLGLLLCILWWTSFKYNHALYLLRIAEARACEPEAGTSFLKGRDLIEDGVVQDPKLGKIAIPWLARKLHPAVSVEGMIYIYGASFLLIIIMSYRCW